MKHLLIVLLLVLMMSCTSTKIVEVPVETVRTEYITNQLIDSVYVTDSVDRWIKGDTLYIYKEHTKYKYVNRIDTVVKIDSIPKIIKVETTKEVTTNILKWYQKFFMYFGVISSLVVLIIVLWKFKKF